MKIIPRSLSKNIQSALQHMPVVFVNGPRQAGKSTLAQALISKNWPAAYVSFDEPSQLGAASANPQIYLQTQKLPLIIDEVQMVPQLYRLIKIIVDELRYENLTSKRVAVAGRFLLTGSAGLMVLPELADALVGRMSIHTLYPLSAVEITGGKGSFLQTLFAGNFKFHSEKYRSRPDKHDLIEVMRAATFPEIINQDDKARHQWFENYIMTILQRDVRQIAEIEKLGLLPALLQLMAVRAGGLINEADIARALGQNAVTIKKYRTLLQMIFLTFELRPWFPLYGQVGKRLVKAPKGYMIDTALLCHLRRINLKDAAKMAPHVLGHVVENFVAAELLKQINSSKDQIDLFHFRTSDNKEVDFVLEGHGGSIAAVEVKAADTIDGNDFKGLKELQARVVDKFTCGVVLYRGRNVLPFADKLWAVPINALWA